MTMPKSCVTVRWEGYVTLRTQYFIPWHNNYAEIFLYICGKRNATKLTALRQNAVPFNFLDNASSSALVRCSLSLNLWSMPLKLLNVSQMHTAASGVGLLLSGSCKQSKSLWSDTSCAKTCCLGDFRNNSLVSTRFVIGDVMRPLDVAVTPDDNN